MDAPFLHNIPGLSLTDMYHIPGSEEDPDRDDYMENLQEAIFAYDVLSSHDKSSDQKVWEIIERVEVEVRLRPESMGDHREGGG